MLYVAVYAVSERCNLQVECTVTYFRKFGETRPPWRRFGCFKRCHSRRAKT